MKKFILVLLGIVAIAGAGVAASLVYMRTAQADPAGEQTLPGLTGEVEIWRDSLAVPHVWATNEADLFRAIGYVHAQDRLFQMELLRRVADGAMAELLGAELVETDRFLRTIGMGRAASATERALPAADRARLQAYADGVNAWVRQHRGALPPEFELLRARPAPWTVRNSLSIAGVMAWDLADWTLGLDLQRAYDVVGPELASELAPRYAEWGVTILPGAAVPPEPLSSGALRVPVEEMPPLPTIPPLTARLLESASISRASNAWVIGGARTRSGKPILANDMHLALRAPSLWYLAALHGGGYNIAGMTIPGVPVVVAGHSDRVAWGFTNAMVDDVDFFVEEVDPRDSTRYRTPDGWAAFTVHSETIRVKGAEPVVHRVRWTRNGPVISDVDPRGGRRVLAMRWTAHAPSTTVQALVEMNRARDAGEFVRALRRFDSPHQNVVFADAAGTIGYWLAGTIPVRRSGDGVLPVPAAAGSHDWERTLRFEDHPHAIDPPEGFIVTANNRQAGAEYPFHISASFAEPYRATRIREMILGAGALTAVDVARQQMDVRDAFAARHLRHAIGAAEGAGLTEVARDLRGWNAEAAVDSRPAALFYTWFEALRKRVGEDEYRGGPMYFPRAALERVLDAGGSRWVDDVRTPGTETLAGLSAAAMRDAVQTVGDQRWGDLHTTRIDHPLGSVALLDRALRLNLAPFPNGGSFHTVNVAGYGGTRPPFRNSYGASQRHVVDMADPDGQGGFVIPTGQSGLPFSEHYSDQTPLWREGRLWRIPLDRGKAAARVVARTTLRPE